MNSLLFFAIVALFILEKGSAEWPITTLKCFSSLTQPDNRLICPAARSAYCVKEVSSLTENLCGKTQYFGDLYQNSQCEFRKCSDHCDPGAETFFFEGIQYSRTRYCCKNDYCNSAATLKSSVVLLTALIGAMMLYLM